MEKQNFLNNLLQALPNDVSINDVINEMNNYICPLDRRNADLVEEAIRNDAVYATDLTQDLRRIGVYRNNSTPERINEVLNEQVLKDLVWEIGKAYKIQGKRRPNSDTIADFILNEGVNFYRDLLDGDPSLVERMEHYVYLHAPFRRHECSWCSKVCKSLNENLFYYPDNDNKYYIYDNNVVEMLNLYRKHYHLRRTSKNSIMVGNGVNWYQNLFNSLEELRNTVSNENLTRFELDHILWGFKKYKVDLVRI